MEKIPLSFHILFEEQDDITVHYEYPLRDSGVILNLSKIEWQASGDTLTMLLDDLPRLELGEVYHGYITIRLPIRHWHVDIPRYFAGGSGLHQMKLPYETPGIDVQITQANIEIDAGHFNHLTIVIEQGDSTCIMDEKVSVYGEPRKLTVNIHNQNFCGLIYLAIENVQSITMNAADTTSLRVDHLSILEKINWQVNP